MASNAFLDANILLEVLLDRPKAPTVKQTLENHPTGLYISALTAHLVVYYGKKVVDLPLLKRFLSDYIIIEMSGDDFEWAFNNIRGQDFEDALQLAVAIRYGCDEFITLDRPLFNTYKVLPSIKVVLANS